ncbi:nitrile hydratase accessory protein [Methylopila sp. 73B]|uniref:nitrile hydratase accessory protein n=1 Tax=Methylopila sp. 73B TaxID=1120792 RepID=UPI000374AE07|nr:nitrile hydratase accessory protein [Methylopila sp. 73B]
MTATAEAIGVDDPQLAAALGRRDGQAPFSKPWELRAFAIAVAACDAGEFAWADFQEALTDAIKNWEAANPGYSQDEWSYYEHFVTALEVVLARSAKLTPEGLDERAQVILSTPPHHHHVAKYEPIAVDPARR